MLSETRANNVNKSDSIIKYNRIWKICVSKNMSEMIKNKIYLLLIMLSIISTAYATYAMTITEPPENLTVYNNVGESRTFKIVIDHRANVEWFIGDKKITSGINGSKNVKVSTYKNNSASVGEWEIKAIAKNVSNLNDTETRKWIWIVNETIKSSVNTTPYIDNDNINVIDITDNKAKITFTVNQSDADTIVRYGTSTSIKERSSWNNETGLSREITLSNLTKGKKYHFSIFAYNGSNKKYFSNSSIKSFTTTNPTKPNISNIEINNITQSSADIHFSIDQEDAKTKVRYGITENLDIGNGWNNNTGTLRSIRLTNLLAGTKYYFSINAYNKNNESYFSNSSIKNFTTKYPEPQILGKSPDSSTIDSIVDEEINFTITYDQIVNITWFLNGTIVKRDSGKSSYYSNNSLSIGTWNVTVTGANDNGSVSRIWTWFVRSRNFLTGNRIWDESKGMSSTYLWTSQSFSGFYYNLNDNLGTEEIKITNIKRNIDKGNIVYKTSPIQVNFAYSGFGKYKVIGFLAGKYFAGYTGNSTISGGEKDVVGSGQLHKIILDDDIKRTISVGSTITLREGYVLKAKEIDVGAGPGQIWMVLLKDGIEIDDDIISPGENYIYKKKVGSVDDLPIIAVHFDSVFRGREVNAAFIKGVFQISENINNIRNGDRYGKMEIASYGKDKITMQNEESVDLSPGNVIDLMGNIGIKIIVADSNTLRFALSVDIEGKTEIEARGTIYPLVKEWTPMNFGLNAGNYNIGFYYDLDEDIGNENIKIENINDKTIKEGKLIYKTSPQEVSFAYSGFGSYNVVGFMAEKYFAGYTEDSTISGDDKDTIGSGQLHKIILDDDIKRVISVGGTITLREGYVLKATDIDVGAGPGQIWMVLLKDGNEIDNDIISPGENYIFKKKVGSVDDLPVIAIHFDSVFRGREVNAAFIKGVFQISENYNKINSGEKYGKMEISTFGANKIEMTNEGDISLSSGNVIDIMGNIKFRVADSNTLRFYPFVTVSIDTLANQLVLEGPSRVTAGETINITVKTGGVGGTYIEDAAISIESMGSGPNVGLLDYKTDNNGTLTYTLSKSLKGKYNITASKLGYLKGTKNIEIEEYVDKKLNIDMPLMANQYDEITIKVLYNNTPINEVDIIYDNITIGPTSDDGKINYILTESGIHTISATKKGYVTTSRDINVKEPYSDFKALDVDIIPNATFIDDEILIRGNITNIGTKEDNKSIELIVNNSAVYQKYLSLYPKETKEINFTYKVDLTEGNYTVKILEKEKLLEVKKKSNVPILAILATIIGMGIIYYITRKK